ncbi:MAG: hypothetical protein AMS22_07505 [Thiotrichales bacterium SG8_50]|nr:MAG: hypothetical protein AMS22_07505 [Thiotrichales bacterium SG8_50]
MRIGRSILNGPNEEILVLPRPEGNIVFRARAVTSMDEFEALVPVPKAPGVLTKEGMIPQLEDETYLQKLTNYNEQRFAYMCIKSLVPSDIEWETVTLDNPKTWKNWEKELREAGLADTEVNRVVRCVMAANALDESKLKEAREVFLRGEAEAAKESSGLQTEPANTPSGEVASD